MRVVAGEAKGRRLKSPKTSGTRPIIDRVKTALFDILSTRIADTRFLDLFAGTGGVGIEALSRGAAYATFIEMSPPIIKLIRENLSITGLAAQAQVLHIDAFKFLQSIGSATARASSLLPGTAGQAYDIIYVAPPQYQKLAAQALEQLDSSSLVPAEGLVIVQIHPKERVDIMAVSLKRLKLYDERRYGSSLLLFYEPTRETSSTEEQTLTSEA